jgi:chromosome segregation ATPase
MVRLVEHFQPIKMSDNIPSTESLQASIKKLERDNEMTNKKLTRLTVEKQAAWSELEELKSQFEILQKATEEQKMSFSSLTKELQESKSMIETLQNDKSTLENNLSQSVSKISEIVTLKRDLEKYTQENHQNKELITSVENEKLKLEDSVNRMQDESNSMKSRIDTLLMEKTQLESRIQMYEAQIHKLTARLDEIMKSMEKTRSSGESQQKSLEKTLSDLKHKNEVLEKEIESLKVHTTESITNSAESFQTEIDQLTKQLRSTEEDCQKMKREIVELNAYKFEVQSKKKENTDETTSLHSVIRDLTKELSDLKLTTNSNGDSKDLEREIKTMRQMLIDHEISLKEREDKSKTLEEDFSKEKASFLHRIDDLERTLSDQVFSRNDQKKNSTDVISMLEKKISDLQRNHDDKDRQNSQQEARLSDQIHKLTSEIDDLRQSMKSMDTNNQKVLQDKDQEISNLSSQLMTQITTSQKDSVKFQDLLKIATGENGDLKKQVDSLKGQMETSKSQHSSEVSTLRESTLKEINNLKSQLATSQKELSETHDLVKVHTNENEGLKKQMDLLKIDVEKNKSKHSTDLTTLRESNVLESNTLKQNISTLGGQLQTKNDEVKKLHNQLEKVSANANESIAKNNIALNEEITILKKQNQISQQELMDKIQQYKKSQQQVGELTTLSETQNKEIQKLGSKLESLTKENVELKKNVTDQGKELVHSQNLIATLTKQVSELTHQAKTLTNELTVTKSDCQVLASENAALIKNVTVKQDESRDLQEDVSATRSELTTMKSKYDSSQNDIVRIKNQLHNMEEEKNGEIARINKILNDVTLDRDNLQVELTKLRDDHQKIELELRETKQDGHVALERVNGELDVKKQELHLLQQTHHISVQENQTILQEVQQPSQQLIIQSDLSGQELERCMATISKLTDDLKSLELAVTAKDEELARLYGDLEVQVGINEDLQIQMESVTLDLEEKGIQDDEVHVNQILKLSTEVGNLKKSLQQLRSESEGYQQERDKALERFKGKLESDVKLQNDLQNLQITSDSLKSDLNRNKNELDSVIDDLKAKNETIAFLEREIEKYKGSQVIIAASCTSYKSGDIVTYCVRVGTEFTTWEIFKRYNDFLDLHNMLLKMFPTMQMPTFPPKLGIFSTQSALEQRFQLLKGFVDFIIGNPKTKNLQLVQEFLRK